MSHGCHLKLFEFGKNDQGWTRRDYLSFGLLGLALILYFSFEDFYPSHLSFYLLYSQLHNSREQPITKLYELKGQALGTTWTIKVLTKNELDEKELKIDVVRRLEELEKIFSHWRPDAKLHQFNSALTNLTVLNSSRIA